jgi:hypothetical protein
MLLLFVEAGIATSGTMRGKNQVERKKGTKKIVPLNRYGLASIF